MNTHRAFAAALFALVVGIALALPASAAADDRGKYILALGDSETAGTQAIAPAVIPGGSPETQLNRSGEGYADQLVARMRARGDKATLRNLACYYETTPTMIAGGGLCSYDRGGQLAEAEHFLRTRGEKVRAIVLSLGANDMLLSCGLFDTVCYSDRLTAAAANLAVILGRLRAAGADVPIAIVNYHNPFLALWFLDPVLAQLSVSAIVQPLSAMLSAATAPFDVIFVDTLAAFQTENFADTLVLPGVGPVPLNVGLICIHSWMCTHNDIHLNASGYAVMAEAVDAALPPANEED